jgi:hypothetical protein
LNNYPRTAKAVNHYKGFVKSYTDKRIIELLKETIAYRKPILESNNLYDEVVDYIDQKMEANITNSIELVPLLCIKYTYFVRNKMFHGEIPESTFKLLQTEEDSEIDNLNILLETLVGEIINKKSNI